MSTPKYHLAQFNIARIAAPLDDACMKEFVAGLDPINGVADDSPGFVWRQKGDDGGASTSIRPVGDDFIISFSVWQTPQHLRDFIYKSKHREYFDRRKEWFVPTPGPTFVMWWVPVGHIPSIEEAVGRFDLLKSKGPSPDAFTFKELHPPPAAMT